MDDLEALNKRVARKLGIHWHEYKWISNNGRGYLECNCGLIACMGVPEASNPNFIAHPEELLREMAKHPQEKMFFAWLMYGSTENLDTSDDDGWVGRSFITDTTEGYLCKAVDEFLKEKEEGNG